MRLLNRIADFAPGNLASLATYGDLRSWPIPLARAYFVTDFPIQADSLADHYLVRLVV